MHAHLHISICLSIYLSVCLSLSLPVSLFIYLPTYLYLCIYIYMYTYVCMYIYIYTYTHRYYLLTDRASSLCVCLNLRLSAKLPHVALQGLWLRSFQAKETKAANPRLVSWQLPEKVSSPLPLIALRVRRGGWGLNLGFWAVVKLHIQSASSYRRFYRCPRHPSFFLKPPIPNLRYTGLDLR